jgi:hypothetical protein
MRGASAGRRLERGDGGEVVSTGDSGVRPISSIARNGEPFIVFPLLRITTSVKHNARAVGAGVMRRKEDVSVEATGRAERASAHFGWMLEPLPGLPGGGMTGVFPRSGVGLVMLGSTSAGGQTTPWDCDSCRPGFWDVAPSERSP